LSVTFAAVALTLATVGLFGLMAYRVTRQTRDIGIRMALGATRGSVLAAIFRQESALLIVGAAVGVPLTVVLSQLARTLLFGVEPTDPLSLAGATLLIVAAGAIAGAVPASRASRVDPIIALRQE
jgi:ABC-type antimicrobial peptide transport system permease subunit